MLPSTAPRRRRHSLPGLGTLGAAWRFFRDPDASLFVKLLFLFALAYLVMPLDVLPDAWPILGWLDDLGLLTVAGAFLAGSVRPYRDVGRMPGAVIDTEGVEVGPSR